MDENNDMKALRWLLAIGWLCISGLVIFTVVWFSISH